MNLVFAVCLVVWCHAVQLLVQHVLKRRRMKELAVLAGLVVLVAASIVPSAISSRGDGGDLESLPAGQFMGFLTRPASRAAALARGGGVDGVDGGGHRRRGRSVVWLLAWTAIGAGIGFILLVRLLLGGGGGPRAKAAGQAKPWRPGLVTVDRLRWVSGPIERWRLAISTTFSFAAPWANSISSSCRCLS